MLSTSGVVEQLLWGRASNRIFSALAQQVVCTGMKDATLEDSPLPPRHPAGAAINISVITMPRLWHS